MFRDWCKSARQVICTKREKESTSEHLYHSLVQRRHETGKKCGLTRLIVPFTMKNSPSHHKAVCVLAQLRVLWYEQKSKSHWQAEKLNKQFWLKPQTNKWAMSPNPRLWHSLLHGAASVASLGSSTTDFCSVCFLVLSHVKASMQCERWQRVLQESGCGRIAAKNLLVTPLCITSPMSINNSFDLHFALLLVSWLLSRAVVLR